MGLGKRIMTGTAATAVAIGGLGIGASTANAVPYLPGQGYERVVGQPGCVTDEEFKPSYINQNGILILETMCDYRTSAGHIIENYRTGQWVPQWSTADDLVLV